MKRYSQKIDRGVRYLSARDPVMRALIESCAPVTSLRLQQNRFAALVHSVLSQQISVHAARSIRGRLESLAGSITAERIADLDVDRLRAIGVSGPKAAYIRELAEKVESGQLRLNRIGRLSDEAVIHELIQVRGIGVWTAQMFLIFSLGRLDVLPADDYGVRAAIQRLYRLDELPDKRTCLSIAEPWRPYATIASWYC